MIRFDSSTDTFTLSGETFAYAFRLYEGKPIHMYFGPKADYADLTPLRVYPLRSFSPMIADRPGAKSFCDLPLEYGEFGRGDFRVPAVAIEGAGFISTDYRYAGHEILSEHPFAGELPLFRDGESLRVDLTDGVSGTTLSLFYTVYPRGLARRAEISAGSKPVVVRRLAAFSLDLDGLYDATGLFGRHLGEREVATTPLDYGRFSVSTSRGASSHQANPFAALSVRGADEETGRVYGAALVYSGSFELTAEADQQRNTRLTAGYNPETFSFPLSPGESLSAPEALLVCSDEGFGGMSRAFADTVRDFLLPEAFARAPRPIVINNWESTYFDFDAERLCEMLDRLKGLGIDMFVLDDGWFGKRDDDTSSLGDWRVYESKLKGGLKRVIDKAKACGMRFGLWFEPEMVNADSDLYRAHPDWVIGTAGREPLTSRHQLVLDFSRDEVVFEVFSQMEKILSAYDIAYIKWDMNRHVCDMPDFTTQHKYILGVYKLARMLRERFPGLLMEGCSGGGGRFDLGMMKFFPQIWCSDNSDAASRAYIQYGSSLPYPLSVSSNHVSICPNHQTGRVTSFKTRGDVAMLGAFGYELNPALLTEEERASIRAQTALYRERETLVLSGDLYRLRSPFTSNAFCFQLVSKDRALSSLTYLRLRAAGAEPIDRIYPKGLDPQALYRVRELGENTYSGRLLMSAGIDVPPLWGDNATHILTIEKAYQADGGIYDKQPCRA